MSLLTGTLSPVRAASSSFRELAVRRRPSAGTESPASSTTMSPGTRLVLGTVQFWPLRMTLQLGWVMLWSASIASSALLS